MFGSHDRYMYHVSNKILFSHDFYFYKFYKNTALYFRKVVESN